jgi:hypothetical protein
MPPKSLLVLMVVPVLQGCAPDNSEDVASLQKQVTVLTRQVAEIHQTVDTLQDTNREMNQLLDLLRVEVNRLKAQEAPPPARAAAPSGEMVAPAAPPPAASPPQDVASAFCRQVWRQLGEGKDEEAVARALNMTVEAVRSCERAVGRGGERQQEE